MINGLIKNGTIGVIDSGIGGLTVLKEIASLFPDYNLVYYGDNINAPYGNKTERELEILVSKAIGYMLASSAKIIVVACNTVSTTISSYVKAISPVPVVFTLPSFIYDKNLYKKPCLLATPMTANSFYVKNNFKDFQIVALPFLAGEIERNILSPKKISIEKDLLAVDEDVDYLYLGCTHYIFLKKIITNILKIEVRDNASAVANSLLPLVPKTQLKKQKGKPIINFVGPSAEYNQLVFSGVLWSKKSHKVVAVPKKI